MKTGKPEMNILPNVTRKLVAVVLILMATYFLSGSRQELTAQPVPHHLEAITLAPDRTVALTVAGSASNMFPGLPSVVSNQFRQMFDIYVFNTSSNLVDWTRLGLLVRSNNDSNSLIVHDANAANLTQRFYSAATNHFVTGFPKPTGTFSVGTCSRVLTDLTRSNRFGLRANSSFMSTFWYPATPPGAAALPGRYTDKAVAADGRFLSSWGWSPQWTNVLLRCFAYSLPDAALPPGTNRFPIILHSPGFTCDRRLNSQAAEELASHGYIVVSVDHEDCHATVFPDDRGVRYFSPGSIGELALFQSRTNDVQFLLGELQRIDSSDPLLKGSLDLDRLGIMGMSAGGRIAAETGREDSRIKCVALLDAYIPDDPSGATLYNKGLPKPFLAMNNTLLDHGLGDFAPGNQRLYTLATNDAILLKIKNAGHFTFTDFAWKVELTSSSRRGAMAINACLLSFFNKYLQGRDDGLLSGPNSPPDWPEIIQFKVK
jgi:dienelactone hydrolase